MDLKLIQLILATKLAKIKKAQSSSKTCINTSYRQIKSVIGKIRYRGGAVNYGEKSCQTLRRTALDMDTR